MLIKQLKFDTSAKEDLLKGVELASKAVGATLGPRGSNVAIERTYGEPIIIHDGVKVLSQIAGDNTQIENQWENVGAKLLYKASKSANDEAGDGSTGAAILTHAILSEGHKLATAGHNPRVLRRGILRAIEELDKELSKMSTPVKTEEQKRQVATISAQDPKIGDAIINALNLVKGGVITIDEFGSDLSIDFKEGMQFDEGLINPVWITDQQRQEAVLDNPRILVTDQNIQDVSQIQSLLESAVGTQKISDMVIIAKDFSNPVLVFLRQNKTQNNFNLVPVKAPRLGKEQEEYLRDIAILVGANFISSNDLLEEAEVTDLGSSKRVTIGEKSTIIIGGKDPKHEDIKTRLAGIDEQLKRPDVNAYDKERLRERKSKLTTGIAIIHVGDDPERKEQVLDAINATKSAISEGVVPGGETALLRARKVLKDLDVDEEEKYGVDIVYKAVEQPFKILIENAGKDPGELLGKVLESGKGYNVQTLKMSDLEKDGVLDPVRVVKAGIKHAGKQATAMLTTNVLVTLKRQPDDTRRTSI